MTDGVGLQPNLPPLTGITPDWYVSLKTEMAATSVQQARPSPPVSLALVYARVCRHVCGHVYRHVYRHVFRRVGYSPSPVAAEVLELEDDALDVDAAQQLRELEPHHLVVQHPQVSDQCRHLKKTLICCDN